MRRVLAWVLLLGALVAVPPGTAGREKPAAVRVPVVNEYVVLYAEGVDPAAARAAIAAAGGVIVRENRSVGVATVRSTRRDGRFMAAARLQPELAGSTPNLPIGRIAREVEPGAAPTGMPPGNGGGAQAGSEPLASRQWDMQMIGATPDGTYKAQLGDRRVLVGVIDSGIDGSHPDIAPNFDRALSRNFTTDIPEFDGPCEHPDCVDGPDEDGNGHGTHVAGIIAAAANGLGIAGVAPNVTLVNLRAGQDSGLFLVGSSVDALTYAGDIGIDVVNMSYYIDPWLYNCPNNAADSPEAQEAQRTTIAATQRALDYAHARGVTLVSAAGNGHTDLDRASEDTVSPNFPDGAAYRRSIDRSCLSMPSDGTGVISVTAVGPSGRKSVYSDYGLNHADIAAPGGDSLDYYGTSQYQPARNQVLSTYPKAILLEEGMIDADGNVTRAGSASVVRDCKGDVCAYYRYLEGTSMASPHVAGVVALIISEYGVPSGRDQGGLTLNPARAERILLETATPKACPSQNPFVYPSIPSTSASRYTARCEGTTEQNGFFGAGLVDARGAVGAR
ncbi:MAG: S8 family serine peptidase [Chloroflexia bacterium]